MAIVLADRVKETTNTTGTGTLTLAGAVSGFQSFAAIGNANETFYCIVSGTDWEVGQGTYTASGTTLSRDTVFASSAGGAKITVASGAEVFATYPADSAVTDRHLHTDKTFAGLIADGVVIDYLHPFARISVETGDGIRLFTGGVAGTQIAEFKSNGDTDLSGVLSCGVGSLLGGTTNPQVAAAGSANNYVQLYIHNDSAGTSASADLIAYPDNGTDAAGWADLGMTSSVYSDATYSVTGPNEAYLFASAPSGASNTGNLVYATDSTGTANAHQWYIGGFNQAKSAYKMQLGSSGLDLKTSLLLNGAAGTSGYVLTSAGAGSIPTWQPASGGGGSVTVNDAVAAAGTTQGTATGITDTINFITSGTGGVILGSASTGAEVTIVNHTAASVNVYPTSGQTIDNGSANAPLVLYPGNGISLVGTSTTNFTGVTVDSWDDENSVFSFPAAAAVPPTPPAGVLNTFARNRAGRMLPGFVGPSGIDTTVQPALFGNSTYMWLPGTGTTVAINWGTNFTARNSGTSAAQATPAKTSTNAMSSMNRATFGTGTTATGASGIQSGQTVAWRGNAAGLGGFFFFARFGIETLATDQRAFVGLSANNAAMAADSSTWNNTIGICKDTADSVWQIVERGTAATKTSTGCTVTAGQILDFWMFAPPNGSTVTVRLADTITGTVYVDNVAFNTTLPAATTFLYMQAHTQSVTGTTAKLLALNRIYCETDL